jgi:hypothetical protein
VTNERHFPFTGQARKNLISYTNYVIPVNTKMNINTAFVQTGISLSFISKRNKLQSTVSSTNFQWAHFSRIKFKTVTFVSSESWDLLWWVFLHCDCKQPLDVNSDLVLPNFVLTLVFTFRICIIFRCWLFWWLLLRLSLADPCHPMKIWRDKKCQNHNIQFHS